MRAQSNAEERQGKKRKTRGWRGQRGCERGGKTDKEEEVCAKKWGGDGGVASDSNQTMPPENVGPCLGV